MKRVVITGAGTINALGHSVDATLAAMREGVCGIGQLVFRDVERLQIQIGGQVRGFEAEGRYNRQQMSLYDRFTQFTLAAAREAIEQSGLVFSGELAAKSGVVLGTADWLAKEGQDGAGIDLTKAFDNVDHEAAAAALRFFGTSEGIVQELLASWQAPRYCSALKVSSLHPSM